MLEFDFLFNDLFRKWPKGSIIGLQQQKALVPNIMGFMLKRFAILSKYGIKVAMCLKIQLGL